MTIVVRGELPEDRQRQYVEERGVATPAVLELAQLLQRACFHGRREFPASGFEPAPVYLTQATVLAAELGFRLELRRLLERLS